MRQFAFYIPELNAIVFLTVCENYSERLEWGWDDLARVYLDLGRGALDKFDLSNYLITYLGEL